MTTLEGRVRLRAFHYVVLVVYYAATTVGFVPVSYDSRTYKTVPSRILSIYWMVAALLRTFAGIQAYFYVFLDMNMWNIKLIASLVVGIGFVLSYVINLLSTIYYRIYANTMFRVYNALVDNVERNLVRYLKKDGMFFFFLMFMSGICDLSAMIFALLLRGSDDESTVFTYILWTIRIHLMAFSVFVLFIYTGFMFSVTVTLQVFNEDVIMAYDKLNGPIPKAKAKSLPNHEFLLRRLIYKYKLITGSCNVIHNSFKIPMLVTLLYVYIDVVGGSFASYYIQVHYKNQGDDSLTTLRNLLLALAFSEVLHMYLIFYSAENVRTELQRTREILLACRYWGTDTRVQRRIEIFKFTVITAKYEGVFCGLFQASLSGFNNVFKDIFMTFIVLVQFDNGTTFLSRYRLTDIFGNVKKDNFLITNKILAYFDLKN